jgi:hypothetical protein
MLLHRVLVQEPKRTLCGVRTDTKKFVANKKSEMATNSAHAVNCEACLKVMFPWRQS